MSAHHDGEDCPCLPTVIPVEHPDGEINYVYAHREGALDPGAQAERAAAIVEAMGLVAAEGPS